LTVVRRTIAVVERCRSTVMCRGRITLTRAIRTGNGAKLQTLRCAGATVRIKAGRSATVRLTLGTTCLRILRSKPHRQLSVRYTFTSQAGQLGEREWVMLVLQPPRPPRRSV
jgi:hypothetical protein